MLFFEKHEKFPSVRSSINKIEPIFDNLKKIMNISDMQFHNIYICASEAFNNALMHGNKLNAAKFVELHVKLIGDHLHIDIIDEGDGFDPQTIPDPLHPQNINKASGRGIFIIDNLCMKTEYKRTQRGFCVTMIFDINCLNSACNIKNNS